MKEQASRADVDDAAHGESLPGDGFHYPGYIPNEGAAGDKTGELREFKHKLLRINATGGPGNRDPESALLAQMTTPDGMAKVVESGLGGEVFEDPLHGSVFRFALEYWDEHEIVPSLQVLIDEFPGLILKPPRDDDGATGWLIERLAHRRSTNRLQNLMRAAVETMHADPLKAAAEMRRACAQILEEAPRPGDSGIYVDVGAMLDDALPEPPRPEILSRSDGVPLFYPGEVNLLFGDPEHGKTWVALAACAEALNSGQRVLVADLDHNGAAATLHRLLQLGAPKEALRDGDLFRLCEPDGTGDVEHLIGDCATWSPNVVVVDSTGELLPMFDANSDSADDFTRAYNRVLQPLANTGAAVLLIDHLAKNKESRQLGPMGSMAKRRAVGGLCMRVVRERPFAPGDGGAARLLVNKDRHGGVRAHAQTSRGGGDEQLIGTFLLDRENDGTSSWRVTPPQSDSAATAEHTEFRPTALMERASQVIEQNPGKLTRNGIAEQTGGRKRTALSAVDLLAREGYLTSTEERYPRYTSTKPYRQVDDPCSDHYPSGNDHRDQISASDDDL
ncbi:AAA family ATPase [Mycobacteroides chelonae]|uniref:AAA family ATPase n=1 Tax=Mycobacteroides chelonae TaxID=1774 RepID=A0A1S1M0B2_MYCCH|nr:AAA family ATPase [Mycobacteroides chelonae]MBF9315816.1 AAA family ATPase [Mycobacteroides chelonae]OHT68263.1 hypothetical protein BKG66_18475 [Mycobacteroides chelonae]OHT75721.1 hypothetical protein BKG67_05905 [Mycobacteroides chelonae]OHT87327.1 hypothetical protein BKG70_12480 [Mycobacteroides chelonae]OHU77041.1 hypothetical protein BKG84_00075 [Mycobacteroides chelonae]